MVISDIEKIQWGVCQRLGADYTASPDHLKLGISLNVGNGMLPLNGLRHPPKGDTTGWYIWAGEEWSDSPDFFQPLHVTHIDDRCPAIKKYLGLAPGWRFLIADNYEDVWFDAKLLEV